MAQLVEYAEDGEAGGGRKQDYFVELWDVGAHDRYKALRSVFYQQINGVILVHELTRPSSKAGLHKWAAEVAAQGSFSAPHGPEDAGASLGGLPVPHLVIGTKADISGAAYALAQQRRRDALHCWMGNVWQALSRLLPVRLHRWRRPGDLELAATGGASGSLSRAESAAGDPAFSNGLTASATQGRVDLHAVNMFFKDLIERRYYSGSAALRSSAAAGGGAHSLGGGGPLLTPPTAGRMASTASLLSSAFSGSVAGGGGSFSRAASEWTPPSSGTGRIDDP